MTKKCACGSDKLQEVKMGGSSVSLVATDKLVFYGGQGQYPTPFVCRNCGLVQFYLSDQQFAKLGLNKALD